MSTPPIDYYEFLQISPNADADTIHRVYRFLASRLHPDNLETGHAENFHLLKTAYDVLSNPAARAEYDAKRRQDSPQQPLSATVDFMDALDGEVNRRLAVLAVLYYRRRTTPNFPEVTLAEIEERMGFPRDYLDFTMWYLAKKGYIARADNAQFTLSADGVDYVEAQRINMPILNKLLTSGSGLRRRALPGPQGSLSLFQRRENKRIPGTSAARRSRLFCPRLRNARRIDAWASRIGASVRPIRVRRKWSGATTSVNGG